MNGGSRHVSNSTARQLDGVNGVMCQFPWQLRERTRLSCLSWHGEDFLERGTFEPDLKDNRMVIGQRRGYLDREQSEPKLGGMREVPSGSSSF